MYEFAGAYIAGAIAGGTVGYLLYPIINKHPKRRRGNEKTKNGERNIPKRRVHGAQTA
jgi:hypothetical protein